MALFLVFTNTGILPEITGRTLAEIEVKFFSDRFGFWLHLNRENDW